MTVSAAFDPQRHFVTGNCRIAKDSLYHLVGDGQKARQEHRACQKAPFKLAAAGINCAC
jgi:hypothetical protein